MEVNSYISALIQYGLCKKLFEPCDKTYITNRIIEVLQLDEFQPNETRLLPLEDILKNVLDDAVARNVCKKDIARVKTLLREKELNGEVSNNGKKA